MMRGFLGITSHFLDSEWKVHSNLMTFCELDGPHMGENIGKTLLAEIEKNGTSIEGKSCHYNL